MGFPGSLATRSPSLEWKVNSRNGTRSLQLVACGFVSGEAQLNINSAKFQVIPVSGLLESHELLGRTRVAWADIADGDEPRVVLSLRLSNYADTEVLSTFGQYIQVTEAMFYTPDGRTQSVQVSPISVEEFVSPQNTRLLPNYPNPFNPETWIPYELVQEGPVFLYIYDTLGRRVRTLDLGSRNPGLYLSRGRAARWDGRNEKGESVASGIYYVELRTEHAREVRRLIVHK
jgi:hypothetical protein